MRKTRKSKLKGQKQILLVGLFAFVTLMTIGYAAFNTNITLHMKGNIKNPYVEIGKVRVDVVTKGNGLYKDDYEDGRYVYKGANPNNYIEFNNELWRIIAKEVDGTYKIVRNDILPEKMPFDEVNHRDSGSNGAGGTYCANSSEGCDAWASTANLKGNLSEFTNGQYTGTVLLDSSLNIYLNGEYYDNITYNRDKIVNHDFNVGTVIYGNDNLQEQIIDEKNYKWNGKIGLISLSDFIKSNSNTSDCGTFSKNNSNVEKCSNTTWMYIASSPSFWTISPSKEAPYEMSVYQIVNDNEYSGGIRVLYPRGNQVDKNVRPALYLNSNITLSGTGTEENPFVIMN